MEFVKILLLLLVISGGIFLIVFFKDFNKLRNNNQKIAKESSISFIFIGFFVSFFDTLGIGAFAPMTALFKQFKLVKDRIIPGTLNTAMCIPIIVEALIFIKDVKVEPITLISMIIAAVLGAVVGAGIISKLDEKKIQFGMFFALTIVVIIMLAGKFGFMPVGGDSIGLNGTKLVIAVIGNFILGALMTLGIGMYAPCMALVYALGLSPIVAFPIMMSSCAFLMPIASIKFIKENAYDKQATFLTIISGSVGVVMAAYLIKGLPLNILSWVVIVAVSYTAGKLFLDSKKIVNKKELESC